MYAFVQQSETSFATGQSPIAMPTALTFTAGNCLLFAAISSLSTVADVSFTDNLGGGASSNTYTIVGQSPGIASSNSIVYGYAANCKGASTIVSVNNSGGAALGALYVVEYSGLALSGVLLGSNSAETSGPGIGANIISSGTAAITGTPAMIWGLCYDFTGNTVQTSAGTSPLGFTGRTRIWSVISGTANGQPQDCRVTSNGTYGATWGTSSGNQYDVYDQVFMALAEATAATIPGAGAMNLTGAAGFQNYGFTPTTA